MLQFSKTKIFSIILVALLAIYYAVPTFLDKNSDLAEYFPDQRINLGLDLRGGSHLMLEVDVKYYIQEQLNNIKSEIKEEFREESIRSLPNVEANEITLTLKDESQYKKAKKIIKDVNNKLTIDEDNGNFRLYFDDKEMIDIRRNIVSQSIEIIRRRVDESGTKEPTIQAQGKDRILLQVPGIENSEELKSILGQTAKMTFHFVSDQRFDEDSINYVDESVEKLYDNEGNSYYIEKEVILSGDLLVDASPTYQQGQRAVGFRFNGLGARKFAKITKENLGRIFAIVLDGKVVTAPRINGVINQGSGVITGDFTAKEVAEVSLLLRAGALPAPLKIIEERTVGPSLGQDSIDSGKIAVIYGFVFVIIFMMIFYGIFGFIADIAMFFNIAAILSILSLLGATLTLPGIAGIVLTIGMSVDANVLIFERIKEELRDKKTVLAAIDQGFSQAYRTIIDSNITTLIVAFFLFAFGNGPVKGFAATLSIGILSSMFTAIVLTRMMIVLWIKSHKRKPQKLSLI